MVDCSEFLSEYSEFADGLLDESRADALRRHLDGCGSCAEYDRVLRRGAMVVRGLPQLEPSPDFHARLQHRILQLESTRLTSRDASGSSFAVLVTLALVIGATAWVPAVRSRPPVVQLPPVAAHAPHRVEAVQVLFRPGPLLARPLDVEAPAQPQASLLFRYMPLGAAAEYPAVQLHHVP